MPSLRFHFFLLALSLTCILHDALALDIPPQPDGYVTDKAGLVSPDSKNRLEQVLYSFEQQTTNQMVVAIFSSLEGESLEDFSIRLAEKWKVGQKGKDNGVILLIFKEDKKLRIEVGYGLEGVLPDALAGQIINQEIVPYFKKGDFDRGVLAGVEAIIRATQGEFRPTEARELTPEDLAALAAKTKGLIKLVFLIIFCIFILDLIRYFKYRGVHKTYSSCYSFWEWFFRFAILLFILNLLFKIAFYSMLFSRVGFSGRRGGFSGGGGSFGGGGASGRW